MRFSLRTLLLAIVIVPPLMAWTAFEIVRQLTPEPKKVDDFDLSDPSEYIRLQSNSVANP